MGWANKAGSQTDKCNSTCEKRRLYPGAQTHPLESSEDEGDMATQQYVIQETQDSRSADRFTAALSKKWFRLFESSETEKDFLR